MTPKQAEKLVGQLRLAFPNSEFPTGSQAFYARSMLDLTYEEAERAVAQLAAEEHRLPSIAKLRQAVMDERLGLAESHEAWEAVQRHVNHRTPMRKCIACAGFGNATGSDDPCPECRGLGEVPVEKRPVLDVPTRRALDSIGGAWAVKTADRPEILHAQFLKAYDFFRGAALREANLRSLGVFEPAAERLALETGEGS